MSSSEFLESISRTKSILNIEKVENETRLKIWVSNQNLDWSGKAIFHFFCDDFCWTSAFEKVQIANGLIKLGRSFWLGNA